MLNRALRRVLLAGCLFPAALRAQGDSTRVLRVTLLGTGGGPGVSAGYAGPAALVEFGPEAVLVDAGRGATERLQQAGVRLGRVSAVLLTHLHSDHTVGLPELWLARWWRLEPAPPLRLWGPRGTRAFAAGLERAWAYDVRIRSSAPENLDAARARLVAAEVDSGLVFERNGMRVTAFPVDHGPVRCLGYRIDAGGHSVVFSGDDRAAESVVSHGLHVDVLVHDMTWLAPDRLAENSAVGARARAALELLATPEQVGSIFTRAHPRLAVLSHYLRTPTALERTRAAYAGPLLAAEDLTQITIGDQVTYTRLTPPAPR